jgi:hypothetical protein
MLYEYDVGKLAPETILVSFWDINEQPVKVREFARQLFRGTLARMKEIDKLIQGHTKNWRLSRMAAVDRNVLRLAVFELLSDAKTPNTVADARRRAWPAATRDPDVPAAAAGRRGSRTGSCACASAGGRQAWRVSG